MSDEELAGIVYTGTEFEDACNNVRKFCQEVPLDDCWLDYLLMADELNYLQGSMRSIMEEEPTEENKKRLAVLAREIDRIVN